MPEYYQISIQWHLNPTTFITFLMKNSLMFFMELVCIGSYEFEYRSVASLERSKSNIADRNQRLV
jgi:hypothetical protein